MNRASRTFWNPLNGVWRHGQALANGCRCRATCSWRPGKQWQGGKWIMATWPGTGTGLLLQGNVCVCVCVCGDLERQWQSGKGPQTGFVSWWAMLRRRFETSKWSMATWPGAGKGLPVQGNVFAVTWEGSGKAVKAHRGVVCRDEPCFAQVLSPPKPYRVWRHGHALAKDCRCRATCSWWPGKAVAKR